MGAPIQLNSLDSRFDMVQLPLARIVEAMALRLRDAVYLTVGLLLLAVGVVSIFVPFIPASTTLIASALFLKKSGRRLQYQLQGLPLVGRYMGYLNGSKSLPSKARTWCCLYLWCNMLVSCLCLHGIGVASLSIVSINTFCCVLGTVFILRFDPNGEKVSQVIDARRRDAESNPALAVSCENR